MARQSTVEQVSPVELEKAIAAAHERIKDHVIRTPTLRVQQLEEKEGQEVWVKLETHQYSGSFKYRGAFNALSRSSSQVFATASAGNHALAVARAGQRLGKETQVVVPINESELKINRLVGETTVTVMGRDVYEASEAAGKLGGDAVQYVSAYTNVDMVAGAGTMMIEAVEEAGGFDTIVVPLGGGGLAAAVAAWCHVNMPNARIVCAHPAAFGRNFSGGSVSEQLRRPVAPSLADGLGIQMVGPSPFDDILDSSAISAVVGVAEEDTAAAIATLLRLQSVLVEGAAATALAAFTKSSFAGRTLLLLTGANISTPTVARAIMTNVSDPTMHRRLAVRQIINGAVEPKPAPSLSHSNSDLSLCGFWHALHSRLTDAVAVLKDDFDRKEALVLRLGLQRDQWCTVVFDAQYRQLCELLKAFASHLTLPHAADWRLEARFRILLQMHGSLAHMFERASPAYDQSQREWFLDTASQGTTGVFYSRYGTANLRALELNLLDVLHLSTTQQVEVLLTSSGMAAYTTVQQYLLQCLPASSVITLPPFIYFEAKEQLQAFPHLRLVLAPDYNAHSIITTAEQHNAAAVFVDPVANVSGVPSTDIRQFMGLVSQRPGWEARIVVVDGTLVSGGMTIFDWAQGPHRPTLLYYESASKYLQLGLDVQLGGVVAYTADLDDAMRTIRTNAGTVMYSYNVAMVPPLTREIFRSRMALITQNAEHLHALLVSQLASVAYIAFPSAWRDLGWRHGGGLLTIRFYDDIMNNKDGLEACIHAILRAAEATNVPITKGVSFGFSTTRVSVSALSAKNTDPFLRIAVGTEGGCLEELARAIAVGVLGFCRTFVGVIGGGGGGGVIARDGEGDGDGGVRL